MICPTCQDAAGRRAPRSEHCNAKQEPGARCDCQHRDDRYRTAPAPDDDPPFDLGAVLAIYEQHATNTDAHAAAVETAARRLEGEPGPEIIQLPRAGERITALPPMIRHLSDGEDPDTERPVITAAMLRATPHTDTTKD